jgi:hypothetical protein
MNNSTVVCRNEKRRKAVREKKERNLNGLDFLEVSEDQLTLSVYFLGKAPPQLEKENIRIQGGRRITDIKVKTLDIQREDDPELDDCVHITVDKYGDFSTYCLCLIEIDAQTKKPIIDKQNSSRYITMKGFDPRYACLEFSFKAGCPSDLDCLQQTVCAPEKRPEPEINYLAKDYASFRQLILDRLALLMPEWQERHIPDQGITLVELLAYAGDHLSYYQDAVATEAYLDTARQRISVRRHARLVDYILHEGCNARTWVTFQVSSDGIKLKSNDFYLITDPGIPSVGSVLDATQLPKTLPKPYLVFEPLLEDPNKEIVFYKNHNEIKIYTWGDEQCCLPKGSTSATLIDPGKAAQPKSDDPGECKPPEQQPHSSYKQEQKPVVLPPDSGYLLNLNPCDIIIFEEVKGPKTGNLADANPARRHAVRLTKVVQSIDPLNDKHLIVEIEWAQEDALPFNLCISSIKADDCTLIENVSIVLGNVVLVDHGETVKEDKPLGPVPTLALIPECSDDCAPREVTKIPGYFRPTLAKSNITFRQPLLPCRSVDKTCMPTSKLIPASVTLNQDVRQALPEIKLYGIPTAPDENGTLKEIFQFENLKNVETFAKSLLDQSKQSLSLQGLFSRITQDLLSQFDPAKPISTEFRQALIDELNMLLQTWEPQSDLLSSKSEDKDFVVEIENDRRAQIRFGNGESGRIPDAGLSFKAVYRIGNGLVGNVGAETITHMVFRDNPQSGIYQIRNPFAAIGGTDPEPIAEAKLFAPQAFRKRRERAITAGDYAEIVMRDFPDKVQRATASLRWTGSWQEMLVTIDPLGKENIEQDFLCEIRDHLYRYRRIGHDVDVKLAQYVSLDIAMTICVSSHYLRGHVKAALLNVFSNRLLADGSKGFFHPDNLSFGEGICLSQLAAAAQAVVGVESVVIDQLKRSFEVPNLEIENGLLPLGPFEIARLDNDPSFPENGKFTLDMRGGR